MLRRNAGGKALRGGVSSSKFAKRRRIYSATRIEAVESRIMLTVPPLPVIPTGAGHLFEVTSYGAVGNGSTNDTSDIQAAITAASNAGGGIVEFTAASGAYESGALTMASNVDLQIDSGAELQALSSLASSSTFISCSHTSNFEITGLGSGSSMGRIDGNNGGVASNLNMITLNDVNIGLIQNVQVTNSPHEHINGSGGSDNDVTINGVVINTGSAVGQTDGIDPQGTNWLIENCTISDGDDDIAVKPESVFCSNIIVENCTILSGHGISVGGETNAGLNGFYVNNVTFNGTTNGLRLKADVGNGGVVENVVFSNITMTNVQYPILVDSYYNQSNDIPTSPTSVTYSAYVAGSTPLWENVIFANVTSTDSASNSVAGIIYGLPEALATNFDFVNVKISAHVGMQIDYATGMYFDANTKFTAASGSDVFGSTTGSPTFPNPYDSVDMAAGYANADIGSPTVPNETSEAIYDPGSTQWTIMGDGGGFSGSSDQFNSSFGNVIGNATEEAELTSLSAVSGATPIAGVMFRNSNSATDPFVAMVQTQGGIIDFEYRTTASGAVAVGSTFIATVGTYYLEITRSGSTFTGSYSTNGTNWTTLGTISIAGIGTDAKAGLAVTSGSNGNETTALFSHVSVLTGPSVATPASANPNATNGLTTSLSVLGSENGTDSGFTYIWQSGTPGAAQVLYTDNDTNTAKNNTATFPATGTYPMTALIIDPLGLSTSSSFSLVVDSVYAALSGSTLDITLNGNGAVSLSGSGSTVTASQNGGSVNFTGVTSIVVTDSGTGDTLNFNGGLTTPITFTGMGSSTVNVNGGTLNFASAATIALGVLNINTAALAAVPVNSSAQTQLLLNGLSINGGTLDLSDNELFITYGSGSDPMSTIYSYLQSGYNNGAWNGTGIISTSAQTPTNGLNYGLGYSDGQDGVVSGLSSGQIEVKYTLLGDANLDGTVNGTDFSILAGNFGQGYTNWDQGNFLFGSSVNGSDFSALSANFGQGAVLPAVAIVEAPAAPVVTTTSTTTSGATKTPTTTTGTGKTTVAAATVSNSGVQTTDSGDSTTGDVSQQVLKKRPKHKG